VIQTIFLYIRECNVYILKWSKPYLYLIDHLIKVIMWRQETLKTS
jgi:hypothetical protein